MFGMLKQNECLTISTRTGREKRCMLARNVRTQRTRENAEVGFVNQHRNFLQWSYETWRRFQHLSLQVNAEGHWMHRLSAPKQIPTCFFLGKNKSTLMPTYRCRKSYLHAGSHCTQTLINKCASAVIFSCQLFLYKTRIYHRPLLVSRCAAMQAASKHFFHMYHV